MSPNASPRNSVVPIQEAETHVFTASYQSGDIPARVQPRFIDGPTDPLDGGPARERRASHESDFTSSARPAAPARHGFRPSVRSMVSAGELGANDQLSLGRHAPRALQRRFEPLLQLKSSGWGR